MVQTVAPKHEIVIHIQQYDELDQVEEQYVAWIAGEKYRGILVTANSISECMKELGISLKVLELYRKNTI